MLPTQTFSCRTKHWSPVPFVVHELKGTDMRENTYKEGKEVPVIGLSDP